MCDFLDNFDFASTDAEALSLMVTSVTSFLKKVEEHYANVLDVSQSMANSPTKDVAESSTIISKT